MLLFVLEKQVNANNCDVDCFKFVLGVEKSLIFIERYSEKLIALEFLSKLESLVIMYSIKNAIQYVGIHYVAGGAIHYCNNCIQSVNFFILEQFFCTVLEVYFVVRKVPHQAVVL